MLLTLGPRAVLENELKLRFPSSFNTSSSQSGGEKTTTWTSQRDKGREGVESLSSSNDLTSLHPIRLENHQQHAFQCVVTRGAGEGDCPVAMVTVVLEPVRHESFTAILYIDKRLSRAELNMAITAR